MTVIKNPKRPGWIGAFKYQRKQYRKEGFQTKADARIWVEKKRKEVQTRPQNETRIMFSEFCKAYIKDCQIRMQLNTWRQKIFEYSNFGRFLGGDAPVHAITKKDVMDFLVERRADAGNKAANRSLRDLKALWNWGIASDLVIFSPLNGIKRYPEEPVVKYIPPPEDVAKVILVAQGDEQDLILTVYHLAARLGEVLAMTWEDVNFDRRQIILWTRKRKGGERQPNLMPMNDVLHRLLKRRWGIRDKESPLVFPGWQRKSRKAYRIMRRLCDQAGVKEFGFHNIRHHVASLLQDSGKATPRQLRDFLRHKRLDTTDRYLRELTAGMTDLADLLAGEPNPEPNLLLKSNALEGSRGNSEK